MDKPQPLLTRRDVATWLRIRPERVDVLIRENGFPAIFLPNRNRETLRFSRISVEAWLRAKEEFLPE